MTPTRVDCECGAFLKRKFTEAGIDANVSPWHAGIVPTAFEPLNMRCPHGVQWHAEPTSDQRVQWARDGVR